MPDSPVYDFSNPVMMAIIVNPDGERIPLWTNSFGKGDLPALPVLTELTIELQPNFMPKITATLAANYQDILKFLTDRKIQYGLSSLQVQFGYIGKGGAPKLSPVYTGLLTTPDVSIAPEGVSITLTGTGVFAFSAQRQSASGTQLAGNRLCIIDKLLRGPDKNNPRKIILDKSGVEKGSPAWAALNDVILPSYAPSYVTDWVNIRKVVRDAGCWMRFEQEDSQKPAKLKLYSWSGMWAAEPTHAFVMYPGSVSGKKGLTLGPVEGVYPVLTFNSPTTGVHYPTSLWGAVVKGISDAEAAAKKKKLEANRKAGGKKGAKGVTDPSPPPDRAGPGGAVPVGPFFPDVDDRTFAGAETYNVDGVDDETFEPIRTKILGQLEQQLRAGGLKVEIGSLGIPDLFPGNCIEVRGLGKNLYDYKYGVFKVTHSLGSGGFSTNVEAWYNTSALKEAAKAAGQVSNQPAKEGSGGSSTQSKKG